jgi:hypothetical protein
MTAAGRVSRLPVSLPAELLAALEASQGGGAMLSLTTCGGLISLPGNRTFSFSMSGASDAGLGTVGQRTGGGSSLDKRRVGLDRVKVTSKEEEKRVDTSGPSLKLSEKVREERRKEEAVKRKKGETTTPESGYGTGTSSRSGVFEDEEDKVQDADELSDDTPFKKRKLTKPANLAASREKSQHKPVGWKGQGDIRLVHKPSESGTKKASVVRKGSHLQRLDLPPPRARPRVRIGRRSLMRYPNVDTSFLSKYPPIRTACDREAYKEVYEESYPLYMQLHLKLAGRADEFLKMEAALPYTTNPSGPRAEMSQLLKESRCDEDVPHYKYLHEKLAHIQRLCGEWDLRPAR